MADQMKPEKSSPYAPIRLRTLGWWKYADAATRNRWVTPHGEIAAALPDHLRNELILPYIDQFANAVREEPEAGGLVGQFVADMISLRYWVPLVGQYLGNGKQIFDLADALVEVLNHTDVKDATLEGLALPYEALYMRFGKQDQIRVPYEDGPGDPDPWEYFEGAFVARARWTAPPHESHRIVIGLTTVLGNGAGRTVPGYIIDFHPAEQALPALEAIEAAIERRKSEISKEVDHGSENEKALALHRQSRWDETAYLLRQALPLVLNGLFYLESLETTPPAQPGRDTPADMCTSWGNATPARRQKLKSNLTREGYAVVHLVGQDVEPMGVHTPHGAVSPHWRRGHWRMQAYGEKHTLRKRIRIAPQFINPHHASPDEVPGHIYVPGTDRSQ